VDPRLAEIAKRRAATGEGQNSPGTYLLSGGMIICSECGGNFEVRKKTGVYSCATRRPQPGLCSNTLKLPIEETDRAVLDELDSKLQDPRFIQEVLAMVTDAPDQTERLTAEKGQLKKGGRQAPRAGCPGRPFGDRCAPKIKEREA